MPTQRHHTRLLSLDGLPDREPQTDNTLRCRLVTLPLCCTHEPRMNVISGAVVNSRSTRSRWMSQLFCSPVGHRPRNPHASAARCIKPSSVGTLPEVMFCTCSLLDATKLVGTIPRASLTRSPATHAQRALLFRCVRQQTCCKMVPASCPVSLILSTKGASAVRSLVHSLVLVVSMLDCLMFSQLCLPSP